MASSACALILEKYPGLASLAAMTSGPDEECYAYTMLHVIQSAAPLKAATGLLLLD